MLDHNATTEGGIVFIPTSCAVGDIRGKMNGSHQIEGLNSRSFVIVATPSTHSLVIPAETKLTTAS